MAHTPLVNQLHCRGFVLARPYASPSARCVSQHKPLSIEASQFAINPPEADCFLHSLFMPDSNSSRALLVVDQPDFVLSAVIFHQPFSPLTPALEAGRVLDIHAESTPWIDNTSSGKARHACN